MAYSMLPLLIINVDEDFTRRKKLILWPFKFWPATYPHWSFVHFLKSYCGYPSVIFAKIKHAWLIETQLATLVRGFG